MTGPQPDLLATEAVDVAGVTTTEAVDVAEVTARLAGLEGLPVADHVPVFEAVHRALQETLAAVDGS